MMPFWQVKQKFGEAISQQIYNDKKEMEKSKKAGDANVYFMEHPEAKGEKETWYNQRCIFLYPMLG